MRPLYAALFLLASACAAQNPPGIPPQPTATLSATLQPALNLLQQTIGSLQPAKWKTSAALRQEADANISSIRRDLQVTLPPLLATADAAPGSVGRVLPAYRNIEALYDVLLRVSETAKVSAPSQQSAAVEQALVNLEDGRRALGDRLQSAALNQDQQLHNLQTDLHAPPPAPVPVPCTPPPPTNRKPRPKHAKKPSPSPATSQTGTPPSP